MRKKVLLRTDIRTDRRTHYGKTVYAPLFLTFIRPVLEFASVVLDGCCSSESDLLEKVQLCAVRIVTGLPIIASIDSLYLETGLELCLLDYQLPN